MQRYRRRGLPDARRRGCRPTAVVALLAAAILPAAIPAPALTPTPALPPPPRLVAQPTSLTLPCAGGFDGHLANGGPPGTTVRITVLQIYHGYSQGDYGQGFSWETSGIQLPISLASGATLTIPVAYTPDSRFPSRLH